MTRLQKKCLIAAAGTHFLLVVALLCSGFIKSKPKADDLPVLDMIPTKAIDEALTSGVRGAQPPPPDQATPPTPPQPQPTPQPPQPQPQVQPQPQPQPPPPQPQAEPPKRVEKPVEPVKPKEPEAKPIDKLNKDDLKPVEKPRAKPQRHEIEPNLVKVTGKPTKTADNAAAEAAREAREAKRLRDARIRAIERAARAIRDNATSATTIDMPGDSSVAYANYAAIVKTVYTQAWVLPENANSDEANVKVSVTIANDGHVIEAHIIDKSGDAVVDRSVQRTLDRVTNIEPFPDGSTEKQRTYIINFNLKAKREMLG